MISLDLLQIEELIVLYFDKKKFLRCKYFEGFMTNKFYYPIILLTIIIISFPDLGHPEENNEIHLKPACNLYYGDVINYLQTQRDIINLGLTIDIKIKNLPKDEIEKYKDIEEEWFYTCLSLWKDIGNKVKAVDRRHLNKVLEEQKLSSSGITDSETVKLGKILNLDIILLENVYSNLVTQKLLKIDTGEVLLFRTHELGKPETKKKNQRVE